jgi:hypothetical protein
MRAVQQSSTRDSGKWASRSTKLHEVPKESAPVAGGGVGLATGAGLDFGVTPDQDGVILRIEAGLSLFYFGHSR